MMGGTRQVATLALDRLKVNPGVALRLPFSLACRYRALPVAEADGQITVAMADPGDPEARTAILAALDGPACLVSGDPLVIDMLLAEIWPGESCHSLQVAVYIPPDPAGTIGSAVIAYAEGLGCLLKTPIRHTEEPDAVASCDLVVMPDPAPSRSPVIPGSSWPLLDRAALIAYQAHWPIRHVLLLILGIEADPAHEAAVAWTVRLARPSAAVVTILAVAPPGLPADSETGLSAWLTASTTAGGQIKRAAGLLVEAGIEGRLRLRQGQPELELVQELAETEYDLAVLVLPTADTGRTASNGEPGVMKVLRRAQCPMLIVPSAPDRRRLSQGV